MGFADSSMEFLNIDDFHPILNNEEMKKPETSAMSYWGIEPTYELINKKRKYKAEWAVFALFPELSIHYRRTADLNRKLMEHQCRNRGVEVPKEQKSTRLLPIKEFQVTPVAPTRCVLCYQPIPIFENVYLEVLRIEELYNKIFGNLGMQPSQFVLDCFIKRATLHPLLKNFDFDDEVVNLCKEHFQSTDIDDYGFVKKNFTISFNPQLLLTTYELMKAAINENEEVCEEMPESSQVVDENTESECFSKAESLSTEMDEQMDEQVDTQSEFSIEEIPLPQIDTIPMPASPFLGEIPLPSECTSVASTLLNTSSDMEISDED